MGKNEGVKGPKETLLGSWWCLLPRAVHAVSVLEVLATVSELRVQIFGRSGFRFSFKAQSDTSGSEHGNSPCLVLV